MKETRNIRSQIELSNIPQGYRRTLVLANHTRYCRSKDGGVVVLIASTSVYLRL